MKRNRDAGFVLGLLAVGALIAVAVFMLLIRPAMASISTAEEAKEAAVAFNQTLEIQLAQYQAEAEMLPETRAQIEEIQTQVTPWEDTPLVRRDIYAIFAEEGLTLKADTVTNPALMPPGSIILQPAAQAVGRESYVDGLTFQNLYATTFDFEVTGSREALIRALAKIQMHEDRYLLVSGFEFGPDTDSLTGAFLGRIQVVVFTLLDPTGEIDPGADSPDTETDDDDEVEPSPSPSASPSPTPSPSATPSPAA